MAICVLASDNLGRAIDFSSGILLPQVLENWFFSSMSQRLLCSEMEAHINVHVKIYNVWRRVQFQSEIYFFFFVGHIG